ncbi:hypothetical protein C0993_007245 [Termitomyces sp. T159_Od127]|nr:hypothetical protein C0993_007245 [Termitomyces sp. T159_Od127]
MTIDVSNTVFTLPDFLAAWPWKRKVNPGSNPEIKTKSLAWIQSFVASTPRLQQVFERGDFCTYIAATTLFSGKRSASTGLLASLAYPLEDEDVLRVACDLLNWYFLFDEFTDVATPQQVQEFAIVSMEALRNPEEARPVDECIIGEAARQFWHLSSQYASSGARRRFIEAMDTYTTSIVREAQDRAENYIRSLDEYVSLRRDTVGVKPSLVVLEFGLSLPDEFFDDPVVQRLTNACVDIVILSNVIRTLLSVHLALLTLGEDVYSYNVEQARGDGHNIVAILMHRENFALDQAMEWIGDYASRRVQNFLDDFGYVPDLGEEFRGDAKRYLDGLGNWVRAHDCWSFESRRYFATGGMEIQHSRKVALLPRSNGL